MKFNEAIELLSRHLQQDFSNYEETNEHLPFIRNRDQPSALRPTVDTPRQIAADQDPSLFGAMLLESILGMSPMGAGPGHYTQIANDTNLALDRQWRRDWHQRKDSSTQGGRGMPLEYYPRDTILNTPSLMRRAMNSKLSPQQIAMIKITLADLTERFGAEGVDVMLKSIGGPDSRDPTIMYSEPNADGPTDWVDKLLLFVEKYNENTIDNRARSVN